MSRPFPRSLLVHRSSDRLVHLSIDGEHPFCGAPDRGRRWHQWTRRTGSRHGMCVKCRALGEQWAEIVMRMVGEP